jgi:hypothetical protein
MKAAVRIAATLFASTAALALAQAPAPQPEEPVEGVAWEFAATGYWNDPRPSKAYGSGIFAADRGPLHLEARINYESIHAQSAFIGWTFAAGSEEGLSLEVTPIAGAVRGDLRGAIVGFEATLAAGRFDYYLEAEYVRDRGTREDSYTYAWTELGFKPIEPVRLGIVAQRTRAYGGDRELQRGGFAQYTHGKVTFGVYWFNPGSSDQIVIGAVGFAF